MTTSLPRWQRGTSILSRPFSSLTTIRLVGSPALRFSLGTLVVPFGMSSSNCLSGHVSMGSGGRAVEITCRGCVAVRIHWFCLLVLFCLTSPGLSVEIVAVLFCPSVLSCRIVTFSVTFILFFARISRGVSACCAS